MGFAGLILLVIILAIAYVGALFVIRRLTSRHVREGHNDVLVPMFLTAGTLYAVLLAFLVIAVWESYGEAKANAAEEASTLATMYRQTNGMPANERDEFRRLIREYTEAVVKDEWSIQAKTGGASPVARRAVADMYRTYGSLPPAEQTAPVSVEFLRTFSTVAADRNRRTLQAGEQLPAVLWWALIVGGAIVVGMSFFLYMEVFWPHLLMSMCMGAVIGTMLLITYAFNQPFSGPLPLDAGSFEHSLSVYDSVDKGN